MVNILVSPISYIILEYLTLSDKLKFGKIAKIRKSYFDKKIKDEINKNISKLQKQYRKFRLFSDDDFLMTKSTTIRFYMIFYPDKYLLKYPEYTLKHYHLGHVKLNATQVKMMEDDIKKLPELNNRTPYMIGKFMDKYLTNQQIFDLGW